jgi:membrane associated rhomboid family serine protease
MWFLWLFGNNIEDSMTRPRFLAFYLLSGLRRGVLRRLYGEPSSAGANGWRVRGDQRRDGCYLVLFPASGYTLVPLFFFMQTFALPAWVMLLYWAFLQFAGGVTSVIAEQKGGVAFWATSVGSPRGSSSETVRAADSSRRAYVRAVAPCSW